MDHLRLDYSNFSDLLAARLLTNFKPIPVNNLVVFAS